MSNEPLRLLVIGAHPDDAEYHAGGLIARYRAAGHVVKMVSLTNGDAGHQTLRGRELAARRRAEAAASAAITGADYQLVENHDAELLPTLDNRRLVIRLIRTFRPDLVLTHRLNDYHPDHRATSQLVQDAAYLVTVPAVAPDTPHLARDPVMAYMPDRFQKPYPFRPDVAIDVGPVVDRIAAMLDCHVSQFYEWLPFNTGESDQVPADAAGRRAWLQERLERRLREQADRFRDQLRLAYGLERGNGIQYAEAFEGCEYGAPLDEGAKRRLFGFLLAT